MERYEAFACEDCGGTGSVRVHGAEDYGVSFEAELCEKCGGTRVDVGALQAAYRGAVGALMKIAEGDYSSGARNIAHSALRAMGVDPLEANERFRRAT